MWILPVAGARGPRAASSHPETRATRAGLVARERNDGAVGRRESVLPGSVQDVTRPFCSSRSSVA